MKKYYEYSASREEYLAAMKAFTHSTEEIMVVLAYLRNHAVLITYLNTTKQQHQFGRPVLNINALLGMEHDTNSDGVDLHADLTEELPAWLEGLDNVLVDDDGNPVTRGNASGEMDLATLANRHLGVYTQVASSLVNVEEEEDEIEYVTYIYLDIGMMVVSL